MSTRDLQIQDALRPIEYVTERVVGFTGTSKGMRVNQKFALRDLIVRIKPTTVHHGMCEGADTEFHDMVRENFKWVLIEGHPPEDKKKFVHRVVDRLWEPKPYLVRNHEIVDNVGELIVVPRYEHTEIRSGTWATYRYAEGFNMHIYIIWPSGRLQEVNNG